MSRHDTKESVGMSRREAAFTIASAGGLAALLMPGVGLPAQRVAGTAPSHGLPIEDPAFNVKTLGRLQGDLSGKTVFSYSQGQVFGLVPGDGPPLADYGRLLFRVEACAVRVSRLRADGALEERSRSWMFYRDPGNGTYLDDFRNPYTGEAVPVPTFRGGVTGGVTTVNGPEVRASFPMESTIFGQPTLLDWQFIGDHVWISRHAFTRWKEGATGYHKTEMTLDSWICRAGDVVDAKLTTIPGAHSWISQTEWQSWLKMRGRPGAMIWRIDGAKLDSMRELPEAFVARSEKLLPGKLSEPLSWL
ncbi:DUF1838 family protein [Methanothrix soehngenii]|uniref:DUF1838 family protein n=1 Tax=Methanothrix soehngenii TaxID=2223 RepID=UPI00300D6B09